MVNYLDVSRGGGMLMKLYPWGVAFSGNLRIISCSNSFTSLRYYLNIFGFFFPLIKEIISSI